MNSQLVCITPFGPVGLPLLHWFTVESRVGCGYVPDKVSVQRVTIHAIMYHRILPVEHQVFAVLQNPNRVISQSRSYRAPLSTACQCGVPVQIPCHWTNCIDLAGSSTLRRVATGSSTGYVSRGAVHTGYIRVSRCYTLNTRGNKILDLDGFVGDTYSVVGHPTAFFACQHVSNPKQGFDPVGESLLLGVNTKSR